MRGLIAFIVAVLLIQNHPSASACTFCGGQVLARQTLREHQNRATFVAFGHLKNPKFDPAGGSGSTEFHVESVIKADKKLANPKVVSLPRYLPVIGNTPTEYLIFCAFTDGKVDLIHGVPITSSIVTYLQGITKLDEKDPVQRLQYFFNHLKSIDSLIASDAFLEFAKAPDAEIIRAKDILELKLIRQFFLDSNTPSERIGVYALLLGLCGTPEDARMFDELLNRDPQPDRVRENLGGILAGLILLSPEIGWKYTQKIATDPTRMFDQKLIAIGTVRFFQTTRPKESKTEILRCYEAIIARGDIADMAADDLRRWGWWDLTSVVIKYFDAPTHAAPVVRRGFVRYALQCPLPEAKQFIAEVRKKDAKLVEKVEETLKFYEPAQPSK